MIDTRTDSRLWSAGAVLLVLATAMTLGGAAAHAVAPDRGFLDARIQVLEVGAGLPATIKQLHATAPDEVQWVAWTVPNVDPAQSICCSGNGLYDPSPMVCNLETRNAFRGHRDSGARPPGDLRILLRLSGGEIERVGAYTSDCVLNAGGLRVALIEGVDPVASIRLLEATLAADRGKHVIDEALMAIASHADPAADEALARFAHRDSPRHLREKAAFWSGAERGRQGLTLLRGMLRQERDPAVLEQVVFGISLNDAEGALELLLDAARKDERPDVRKRALFWLSQRAGERVIGTLGEAVRDDPDAEVREQAVFALSQLPDGRGIPLLIELARTNRHGEVRRRALFWLGQSGDPRALDLIEQILAE